MTLTQSLDSIVAKVRADLSQRPLKDTAGESRLAVGTVRRVRDGIGTPTVRTVRCLAQLIDSQHPMPEEASDDHSC